ncbi:hypothetical protein ABT282_08715 [Streptomyces sp. NPDC000927]|uniref:hypothetical protein n=1 Tax=Streptomyces sp. NPDC000927 TaxID=3154371 RepID=UPI00332B843A
MMDQDRETPKTDNMSSSDFRKGIVDVMNRVGIKEEHVRAWRYTTPTGVFIPDDWYERACEALGETYRLNRVPPKKADKPKESEKA